MENKRRAPHFCREPRESVPASKKLPPSNHSLSNMSLEQPRAIRTCRSPGCSYSLPRRLQNSQRDLSAIATRLRCGEIVRFAHQTHGRGLSAEAAEYWISVPDLELWTRREPVCGSQSNRSTRNA